MKVIQSAGGSLIGLDRDHLHLWSGINGKTFIGEHSPFRTDYEAAGHLVDGRSYPPCNIAKITGVAATGLLITMPNQTAVLDLDRDAIYIAQIEYGDADWGFHLLRRSDFDEAIYDSKQDVIFSCKSCTYVFFDAAYTGQEILDDCLTFDLDAGQYLLSSALYEPDDRTGLILSKITKTADSVS